MINVTVHGYTSDACVSRVDATCEQFAVRSMVCNCTCHKGPVAYLSGPMTGRPNLNREAFMEGAARLRALGFQVINPATGPVGLEYHEYMHQDLVELLLFADVVVSMADWEESPGATVERSVASVCGLQVADLDDAVALEIIVERWRAER